MIDDRCGKLAVDRRNCCQLVSPTTVMLFSVQLVELSKSITRCDTIDILWPNFVSPELRKVSE